MEIGSKLKKARTKSKLTQEDVADKINTSRQTISNWENENSYPDIISVIELSKLYDISLDDLLKDDEKLIKHLDESTNIVNSNKKLIFLIFINIILIISFILLNGFITTNKYFMMICTLVGIISTCLLFYQIIKKI